MIMQWFNNSCNVFWTLNATNGIQPLNGLQVLNSMTEENSNWCKLLIFEYQRGHNPVVMFAGVFHR